MMLAPSQLLMKSNIIVKYFSLYFLKNELMTTSETTNFRLFLESSFRLIGSHSPCHHDDTKIAKKSSAL